MKLTLHKKWGEELDSALKGHDSNPKNLNFEMVPNGTTQGWVCPCVLLKRKNHCHLFYYNEKIIAIVSIKMKKSFPFVLLK
jgi:ferredoxin-thioredoxin reductase catalytic subunit